MERERNHKILEAIILAYAEGGTPIGSESLLQRFPEFRVSPATIRNVMAELEDHGLVTHPHTSAGRVPTDRGYRYYVDLLMQRGRLRAEDQDRIDGLSSFAGEAETDVLKEATRILSELTQEAGLALVPQLGQGSFRRLQLIPVDPQEVVAVLISSEGMVRHARLDLAEAIEEETLRQAEGFLNEALTGMSLPQAHSSLERSLLGVEEHWGQLWRRALEASDLSPLFEEEASVILEGARRILEAPEFQDLERTHRLVRALEEKRDLAGILQKDLAAEDVKLHIGSENRGTFFTDCTIAGAPYRMRGGMMGTIGVLGPTRMDYPRVTALVGRTALAVSQVLQERG